MMKKKMVSGVLAAALTLSCFGATTSLADTTKPQAKASYSCNFETGLTGFTDFFTTNVEGGMSIEESENSDNHVLKLTGNTNVWASSVVNFDEVTVIQYDFMQNSYSGRTDNSPIRVKIATNNTGGVGWRHLLTYTNSNTASFANGAYKPELSAGTWYTVKYVIYPSGETTSKIELFLGEKSVGAEYINSYEMSGWLKITQFQIFNLKEDLYLDNFSVGSYSANVYQEINACETAEDVKSVIDFYMSNKLMDKKAFDLLSSADQFAVCGEIVSGKPQNGYTDDTEFYAALDAYIAGKNDGGTVYYKWDFENNSLVDYANNAEFMTGNSASKDCVSVVGDPSVEIVNKTAKVDLSTSDEKLVSTTAVKNDLENVRYVVYDARVYHDVYNSDSEQQDLEFQVRYSNATRHPIMLFQIGRDKKWNTYKTVVDTKANTEIGYIYLNGAWTISNSGLNDRDIGTFDPDSLRINNKNNNGTVYFDDVTIKGYKNLYEEVNEADEKNVCAVLEAFETMQLIDLTGYSDLTAKEKAEFAKQVKSITYTDDNKVKQVINILLSKDELVVLSSEIKDNLLDSASIAINANIAPNISTGSAWLIVASYTADEEKIVSAAFIRPESLDRFTVINLSDLKLNVEGADCIKYMLWEDGTFTPILYANTVVLSSDR